MIHDYTIYKKGVVKINLDYSKFEQKLIEEGVTAYRVARDTGIFTSTLSQWKNGSSMPKSDTIKKIADYFGVAVDYFYE